MPLVSTTLRWVSRVNPPTFVLRVPLLRGLVYKRYSLALNGWSEAINSESRPAPVGLVPALRAVKFSRHCCQFLAIANGLLQSEQI